MNSVFNITDENSSFSMSTLGYWSREDGDETINNLNNLTQLRSENDVELYVKEVEKRNARLEIENSGYNLAGFE